MQRDDDVRCNMAAAPEDGDAALAVFEMQMVVEQCGADVACKRGEEDEGDDDVG